MYAKLSYVEDDILTVEDDTDKDILEEDVDEDNDDRDEPPKTQNASGWTSSPNKSNPVRHSVQPPLVKCSSPFLKIAWRGTL